YVCRYDSDGNLLETKQVNINFPISYIEQPVPMIMLASGGFAIATTNSAAWYTYLKIFDHDFNLVHSRVITWPPGYYTITARHICEMPGGDIAISASVQNGTYTTAWINAALILTTPDGTIKSLVIRGDSVLNYVAHAVSPFAGGYFAVSSTKKGWLSFDGTFVNY